MFVKKFATPQVHKSILLDQHRQGRIVIPAAKLQQLEQEVARPITRSSSSSDVTTADDDAQPTSDDSESEELTVLLASVVILA